MDIDQNTERQRLDGERHRMRRKDTERLSLRIGEGRDPIVFALQLRQLADAGLAQQGEGPIIREVGQ